jgi:hypothetical protein
MKKEQQNDMQVELNEETAQGIYANMAIIAHSSSEFVIDFVRMMPGIPKAKVQSRVILMPEHAKRLLLALSENIQKYELQYGEIKLHTLPGFTPQIMGPVGEA